LAAEVKALDGFPTPDAALSESFLLWFAIGLEIEARLADW
jgi:hypothetical protein